MSQICRPFKKTTTVFIRFATKKQYEVVSPLNKFNFNRLYSTTSSNKNSTKQPKNLGYIKAIDAEEDALIQDKRKVEEFDPVDSFETFEPNIDMEEEEFNEQVKIETPRIEVNDQQAPYYHASKRAEKALRSHLNRFFIKVHPDIFHNDEASRTINQNSLTKLNNLLRSLEEYVEVSENEDSIITKLDKIPTRTTLNFVVEFEEDGGIGEISQEFTFTDAPESILTSKSSLIQYVTELRFSVYRQIYSLLEKADISVPKSEKELLKNPEPVTKEIFDDPWEEYYSEDPTKKLSLTTDLDEFIKQFPVTADRLTAHHLYEHQRLMDQFQENRVYFYFGENAKGDMDIMRHLNLREEAEYEIVHLKENLLALEFQEWSNLPIAIVDPKFYNIMEPTFTAKGFVVLEKDFDPVKVLPYIKEVVIPKTTNNFKQIFSIVNHNHQALEEKTIKLENLLGSSSIVVENLFSINQKTLEKVRNTFNHSLTMIGELKIPVIQLLDSVKAETWKQLPLTNFNDAEFQRWKINNVITNTQEKIEYIAAREDGFVKDGRVPQHESKSSKLERINKTMEKLVNPEIQPKKSDIRERPLTIVDKNQFDSVQTTPFISASLSAIDRLTKLFEKPTPVPFLLSDKPVAHPLLSYKDNLLKVRKDIDNSRGGILLDSITNQSHDTFADQLGFGSNSGFDNEMKQLELNPEKDNKESNAVSEQQSKEFKKAIQVFGFNNVIPIENAEKVGAPHVSKIDFMADFDAATPIDSTTEVSNNDDSGQIIDSILKDAKSSSTNISSDLDDFFSKLSSLDEDQPPKQETLLDRIQKQFGGATTEEVASTAVEWKESIQFINQRLSDFRWTNINLIISDHYQFIITHDNKAGFCFIPSNFDEKELFVFLNSVQDSFDLINGGAKGKSIDEYNLKSLLAVESSVETLKQIYKFKSILIDNIAIPSKVIQHTRIRRITNLLQNKAAPDEHITLKNIGQYITLVLSDSFSVEFLDNNNKPIDEDDTDAIQQSKHAKIYIDENQFDLSIFIKYVFVSLSENSAFFKDIITRTYQLPTPPPTPSIDEVKNTINKIYGFNRITSEPYSINLKDIFEGEKEDLEQEEQIDQDEEPLEIIGKVSQN
ncbi:hypothetical protein ACTA71_005217 [Dictyostelium dimigraforme]